MWDSRTVITQAHPVFAKNCDVVKEGAAEVPENRHQEEAWQASDEPFQNFSKNSRLTL